MGEEASGKTQGTKGRDYVSTLAWKRLGIPPVRAGQCGKGSLGPPAGPDPRISGFEDVRCGMGAGGALLPKADPLGGVWRQTWLHCAGTFASTGPLLKEADPSLQT